MATLTPPQAAPKWTHTPEEVIRLTKEALAKYSIIEDSVAALTPAECTFESVFLALALAKAKRFCVTEPLSFYQNVSPSAELRDASTEAESLVREFEVGSSMRIDIFRALQAAEKNIKDSGRVLSPEEQRLIDKMLLDGSRNGLALSDAEREKLTALKTELAQACIDFKGSITFTPEELKGVPQEFISGYTKRTEGDKEVYVVTFKMSDFGPVNRFAENPETRRIMYEAFEDRLAVNEPVLSKVLDCRREIAELLGYRTWADYATEIKMVKTAKGVKQFLADLEDKLRPIGLKERRALLELKKKEHEEKGFPFDGELYIWDSSYYDLKFIESNLNLDSMLLKEHFPVAHVVPTILDIYQDLLQVRFVEIQGETWHLEVQQYALWEKDAKDESDFLGYCYIDLYPREGKFPGAAVWPLLPGYEKEDGSRNYPVAAIVANLAKPNALKPALMTHHDVKTLFHEMGHIFHELLSRTRFARFHGTTVAGDFMEAPSQMLEEWCYEPKVLTLMSSHYQTKKPLDAEFIGKLLKARYANVGLFNLRQIAYSQFDLEAHMFEGPGGDYTQLWTDICQSIGLLRYDKAHPGQCGLHHIIGDYNVGLYGYMYSQVYAADMYATVFKEDPLDPARGRRYREKILLPGSSKDEMDMLRDFLGREPNSEAFVKQLFGA
ncbi:hypothetical protein ONZ51_g322 [Trametes cubensis]|uniref:Peptidase M3A/M3B catalytic domain-containing protein n=1 Tax=Trametes cubensis TaxID=1111947 RepID=A0AAD7XGK7_9APHY|nr:hypothetical protein ONZ51_g322 [Trametes cubensis]